MDVICFATRKFLQHKRNISLYLYNFNAVIFLSFRYVLEFRDATSQIYHCLIAKSYFDPAVPNLKGSSQEKHSTFPQFHAVSSRTV